MSVRCCAPSNSDGGDALVRRVARGGQVAPGADHREHPAPGRHQGTPGLGSAGVDHVHRLLRLGVRDAADHVPRRGRLGIPLAGEDDRDRRTRPPLGGRDRVEAARGGAVQERRDRGRQQREQRLGLGVTEAGVELDDADATRGEREAGVQQPAEGGAAAGHLVDRRLQHRAQHLLDQIRRRPRQRGVGAHPARVGSLVTVEDPLEVLGGLKRVDGGAIGDREQRDLRPVEVLLDQHPLAPRRVRQGGRPVGGDHDPLARREAVVLHHVGGAIGVQGRDDFGCGGTYARSCGRHAGRRHDVLRERLGALEPGRLGGRAEAGDAALGHGVGHAGDEWRLRADHDQVDRELLGERCHVGTVHGIHVVQGGDRGHARVAGGRVHLGHARVEGQGPGERVLAAAGADDEGLHVAPPY